MEIIVAPKAGFCFGVKRALEMAEKAAEEYNLPIYTLGPLIHNSQVVEALENKGIKAVKGLDEIDGGILIIRSHGVSPEILKQAEDKGLNLIDATCPFVALAQQKAKSLADEGYRVVVVGDKEHPEVTGILGWIGNKAVIIESPDEIKNLNLGEKVGIVAQTTQPKENFEAVVEILKEKCPEVKVHNTICHATRERQDAAAELAGKVDVMIVVGGRNSANTRKLVHISESTGTPTYHIETADELNEKWFKGKNKIGLTAGASTPDWIIEEVRQKMEEINQQGKENNMAEQPLETKHLKPGDIVKGVIEQVGDAELLVDIGAKSIGIVPLREISCCIVSPKEMFKKGDEINVYVIKTEDEEGHAILSKRKADAIIAWDELRKAFEAKKAVRGLVTEAVKGGLLLDVGVQAFMPASLVEIGYVKDLAEYVGKELDALVIELNKDKRKVVLSRKPLLEEELRKQKELVVAALKVGEIKKGTVKRLTNFGAFVDIGGIDGLLHVSEMSWQRVKDPSEILKVGDEIEVKILDIDKEKGKVSLSLKQILENQRANLIEKYPVGSVVKGKVVRIASFGAFVEIEPGIDGLVHLSHLSEKKIAKPEEAVHVGQEVKVKVISVDTQSGKISLSIKEVNRDQELMEYRNYMAKQEQNTNITIGDLFGDLLKNVKK